MANNYYNHGNAPATGSNLSSATIRAELDSISAGFDKMPTLTGSGNKLLKVNAGGTAINPSTVNVTDAGNMSGVVDLTTTGDITVGGGQIGVDADSLHTLPNVAADTITLNAATQTLSNKTFTTLTSTGNATLGDSTSADSHTVNGATSIAANSASAALTVTQTGTGDALVVEDSASTDSTPFVIDTSGRVITGATQVYPTVAAATAVTPTFQQHGSATLASAIASLFAWNSQNPYFTFNRAGAGGIGTHSAVASGNAVGTIQFNGSDGTNFVGAASIQCLVDATPATDNMAGRIVFNTRPSGVASPLTERMRIDSNGAVGIGTTPSAKLDVLHNHATEPALRVTQTGTGNAFVVEDSTSTDATPFVIDASGKVIIGRSAPTAIGGLTPAFQIQAASVSESSVYLANWATSGSSSTLNFSKSMSGVIDTHTPVSIHNDLMAISAYGSDGTAFIKGADILVEVDAAVSTGSVPARLTFSTTATGSSTPTERMRIDSNGNVGIGGGSAIQAALDIRKVLTVSDGVTGSVGSQVSSVFTDPSITTAIAYSTFVNIGAGTNVGTLTHYNAGQRAFVGTADVQVGFNINSNLTGATTNYGLYGNLAVSSLTRWNVYIAGTAPNYFSGTTWFGSTAGVTGLALSSTGGTVSQVNGNGTTAGSVDLNYQPSDGISPSTIRIHRATNTTGNAGLQVFLGNNTSTANHYLVGNNSTTSSLCSNNGNLQLGNSAGTVSTTAMSISAQGRAATPTRSTVATGSTITLTTATNHLLYDQAATIAALTITLPSVSLTDGMMISIATRSAITALTVNGGTIYGNPTTLATGGFATFIYSSAGAAWFRKG